MHIARAQPSDADALTQITQAAKRHWGYSEAWLHAWQEQLTLTPDYLRQHTTFIATANARELRPLGFATMEIHGNQGVLAHLWVLPAEMNRGIGRALFTRAEMAAHQAGATSITITSDPHAEAFYLRMGAETRGRQPAPMEGAPSRSLPLLVKELGARA